MLSNGDCVSLDDVRCVRVVYGSRTKVELIYRDGVIFNFDCSAQGGAESLRNEIVAIVNEFEIDVKEQKESKKLEQKVKELTPIDSEANTK